MKQGGIYMLKNTKRTKIVCTLGPASEKEEVLTALIENGLKYCIIPNYTS